MPEEEKKSILKVLSALIRDFLTSSMRTPKIFIK